MRRYDELRVLPEHVLEHRNKPQLTLRREWGLRLVEQVQPTRNESRLEQLEKALSVRVRVEVNPVPTFHVGQRCGGRTGCQPASPVGPVRVLILDVAKTLLELRPKTRQLLREPEKSSARRKKPRRVRFSHVRRMREASVRCEASVSSFSREAVPIAGRPAASAIASSKVDFPDPFSPTKNVMLERRSSNQATGSWAPRTGKRRRQP